MSHQDFKIRCSAIGKIMTESVKKSNSEKLSDAETSLSFKKEQLEKLSEKAVKTRAKLLNEIPVLEQSIINLQDLIDAGFDKELSQTCKTYLQEWFVEHYFDRRKDFSAAMTEKGNTVENAAILFLSILEDEIYIKNELSFENDFCKGTPDIIESECIKDIKSSFDIFSFHKAKFDELNTDYEWQLRGYMMLCEKPYATLNYCLVNTPESIVLNEIRKANWARGYYNPLTAAEENEIWLKHRFDDIEPHFRHHEFRIERDLSAEQAIEQRVTECRAYLATLYEKIEKKTVRQSLKPQVVPSA